MTGLVRELNRKGIKRTSTMWEVAVLHAFSNGGSIKHEVGNASGGSIDLQVSIPGMQTIVADIVTVSDRGLREINPIGAMMDEVSLALREAGLGYQAYRIDVFEAEKRTSKGTKRVLRLPVRNELRQHIENTLKPRFLEFAEKRVLPFVITVDDENAGYQLTLVEGEFAGGTYASFDAPTIVDRNPLYRALKDKAAKVAKMEGIQGVIVTDGDSQSLRQSSGAGGVSTDAIVSRFLDDFDEIEFVLLITVDSRNSRGNVHQGHDLKSRVWFRKHLPENFGEILHDLVRTLPKPINSALNGGRRAQEAQYERPYGGITRSDRMVRIGARHLLEVLAGRKTVAQLNSNFGWDREPKRAGIFDENPFEVALREGRLPEMVNVYPADELENDVFVEIRFGEADPAVSKFK
ncbi:hypothetical protein [Qipengyuania aquimaris]|uniref:hypothetical protein n=1 Tax=Qipengyuania aquimaris TaxID=255984 RepID=UPI001CD6E0B5|nr:hypothetical protein [Qipengyuania aquimaris]MCA0902475.1 hypothetical protein [Qipengyuania aquimaris]